MDSIVQQAVAAFFSPYRPDPASSDFKDCGAANACLRLNASYSHDSETLSFEWTHTSTVQTGQKLPDLGAADSPA